MSEFFYKAVVQAILLYGSETWLLLAAMERKVEGIYTEFLRQITGKRVRRVKRRDVGDAWGIRRTGGSRNAVRDDLHGEKLDKRGTGGGTTSTILGVSKGNRVRRGREN